MGSPLTFIRAQTISSSKNLDGDHCPYDFRAT
nr:MAG TPA: hypothetical protein [Caudoviricetes sp.]